MNDPEKKLREAIDKNTAELLYARRMQTEKITGLMLNAGKAMDAGILLANSAETDSEKINATNVLLVGISHALSAIMAMMYEKRSPMSPRLGDD